MATKLYNSHLNDIILNCKEYYILDSYISLVHISSEVNGKYLIQTFSSNRADIISLVRRHVDASYKTIYNCIETLIERNILKYVEELSAWTLVDMENMTKGKEDAKEDEETSDFSGYTNIRSVFFSKEFNKMKAREKRLVVYMAQLGDSKASEFHKGYKMNLLKPNSSWMKILKTKCKYYAKYTIEAMLDKYKELFENLSEDFRENDLAPKRQTRFKFFFNCPLMKKKNTEENSIDLVFENNPKEYAMVMNKISFAKITLSKVKIMHLVRAIQNLKEWFLKEFVVQRIVNKYIAIQIHHSRENIKSLPAYAAAIVKCVVDEFKAFKESPAYISAKGISAGEYFIEYFTTEKEDEDLSSRVATALSLL